MMHSQPSRAPSPARRKYRPDRYRPSTTELDILEHYAPKYLAMRASNAKRSEVAALMGEIRTALFRASGRQWEYPSREPFEIRRWIHRFKRRTMMQQQGRERSETTVVMGEQGGCLPSPEELMTRTCAFADGRFESGIDGTGQRDDGWGSIPAWGRVPASMTLQSDDRFSFSGIPGSFCACCRRWVPAGSWQLAL
jgi:hypothetical protein